MNTDKINPIVGIIIMFFAVAGLMSFWNGITGHGFSIPNTGSNPDCPSGYSYGC